MDFARWILIARECNDVDWAADFGIMIFKTASESLKMAELNGRRIILQNVK
jgi:hypothetical protein